MIHPDPVATCTLMPCCHGGSCTGHKVDDATRRMMKYIFSNKLAMEYNMFGRHGGKKIKALCPFNFVHETALKKKPFDLKSQPAGSREGVSVVHRYKGQRASQNQRQSAVWERGCITVKWCNFSELAGLFYLFWYAPLGVSGIVIRHIKCKYKQHCSRFECF